ncbi:MAG: hypothetical protein HQL93_12095, partial [Magnetococcales bacterium]|nr:hypothetical protein [Magnetococcales bacterium]
MSMANCSSTTLVTSVETYDRACAKTQRDGVPTIFISYATRSDKAKELIKSLCETYRNEYHFFVDKELVRELSVDWNKRLNEMLMQCDGALILFCEKALDSEVIDESIILINRKVNCPDFLLFYVLLDGISIEDIKGRSNINRLKQFECLMHDDPLLIEKAGEYFSQCPSWGTGKYPSRDPFNKTRNIIAEDLAPIGQNRLANAVRYLSNNYTLPFQYITPS